MRTHGGMQQLLMQRLKQALAERDKDWTGVVAPQNDWTIFGIHRMMSLYAKELLNSIIYWAYIEKHENALFMGLHTIGRLAYVKYQLEWLAYPSVREEGIVDSGWHLTYALASYDKAVLEACIRNFRIANGTHYANAYIHGLVALVEDRPGKQRDNALTLINRVVAVKRWSIFDKALLRCMAAILTKDLDTFYASLKTVLDRYGHKWNAMAWPQHGSVALMAHALYNSAYFSFAKVGLEPPSEPVHKYWDHELWLAVKERPNGFKPGEYIIDIGKVSPMLERWMNELPATIDLAAFWKTLQ